MNLATRKGLLSFVFVVLLLGVVAPAHPWGSKGHEIVAAIAETHLDDAARKRIKELLPQGTTLADASTWPDKAGRQIPDMDPYHFINFPKDANSYNQRRDCKLRNCIIEAIAWYMQVLNSPEHRAMRSGLHDGLSLTWLATSISRFMPNSRKIAAATVLTCASTAGKKTCIR